MNPKDEIDKKITELADWRGELLKKIRALLNEVDPTIEEAWKWETPVWELNGTLCAVGLFKENIKFNFFNGAALTDTHKLFNAGLDAKKTRAIDFSQTSEINEAALKDLITEAVQYNKQK